jgi:hypothetical protein
MAGGPRDPESLVLEGAQNARIRTVITGYQH